MEKTLNYIVLFVLVIAAVGIALHFGQRPDAYASDQSDNKANSAIGQCLQMGGTARLNWDGERMRLAGCDVPGAIRQ